MPDKFVYSWDNLVTSKSINELDYTGYPGWDKEGDGYPPSVKVIFTSGNGLSSHKVAAAIDDWCSRQFYYRDWTDSGIPVLDKGDKYVSGFWFQERLDYQKFLATYENTLDFNGQALLDKWNRLP